jgi:hypothetical protein
LSYPGSVVSRRPERDIHDTRLYLGVAVGAEKDTLAGLLPRLVERPREAVSTDREPLLGRIDVVEV